MPFENIWGHRSVYKRFFGQLTVAEFMRSVDLVQGDPRFDDLAYTLNDFTHATLPPLTEADVKTFAAFGLGASYTNPKIKIAVVTQHDTTRAMALRYAAASRFELQVFTTLAQALTWIPAKYHPSVLSVAQPTSAA